MVLISAVFSYTVEVKSNSECRLNEALDVTHTATYE